MSKAHTLFISDLHLSEAHPKTADLFFQFLNTIAKNADALYILGDFFELWLGDDDRNDFNERIKRALRQFTATGTPTYFMHGNRDFLIRKRFAKETGVQLLKEPSIIQLYNQRILLLHGDSLCTHDIKHQKSRKLMHNRFYQTLALLLPLALRKYFGSRLRTASSHRKSHLLNHIMDVSKEEVSRVMSEANTNILIHGHTHRPAIHQLTTQYHQDAVRIVLGDWHEKGRYLRFNQSGKASLLEFNQSLSLLVQS